MEVRSHSDWRPCVNSWNLDRAPKLDAVKDWAECIQAELEELSKAQSVAKLAQPHSSASNQMPPVVGPSVKALVSQWEGKEGEGTL